MKRKTVAATPSDVSDRRSPYTYSPIDDPLDSLFPKADFDRSIPNDDWHLPWPEQFDSYMGGIPFEELACRPDSKIIIFFENEKCRFDFNIVSYSLSIFQFLSETVFNIRSKMLIWRAISGIEILNCLYNLFLDFCYNLGQNSINIFAELEINAMRDPHVVNRKIVLTKEYDSDAILEFQWEMGKLLMLLQTEGKAKVRDAISKATVQADGSSAIAGIPFDPFFLVDYLWIFDRAAKAVYELDQAVLDE